MGWGKGDRLLDMSNASQDGYMYDTASCTIMDDACSQIVRLAPSLELMMSSGRLPLRWPNTVLARSFTDAI